MKRFFVAAALLLTPSLLPAAEAQPACGDTLTTDTTLTGDMSCTGTALRIGADGITDGRRGILVSLDGGLGAPENNTFEGNHATGNVLFDVRDQTIGDGTAGTDSTYRGTRCDTSSPDGICVP